MRRVCPLRCLGRVDVQRGEERIETKVICGARAVYTIDLVTQGGRAAEADSEGEGGSGEEVNS